MRVLMVNWVYTPEFSGAALQCHRLTLQLLKMGVKVVSLSGTDKLDLLGTSSVDDLKIVRVLRNKSTLYNHVGYGWDIFHYIIKNYKRFDLLHSHGFIAPVNLAAKVTGLPLIQKITDYNLDDPTAVRRRTSGQFLIPIYEMASVVIATSKLLEDTCRIGLSENKKVMRIPNGVETSEFKPLSELKRQKLREQYNVKPDHTVLLSVGTVSHKKGFDTLIKAVYLLKKMCSEKIKVWIVGPEKAFSGYGESDPAVERYAQMTHDMVKEFGLEEIIEFKGEQENVHEFMQAADIYIHPSKQEGQPNSILEAMSCGLPVVANLIPGITDEIIQTGKYGYLVNCHETDVFSAALRVLINNKGLCKRLGE
ncbi:glycosyltransferase family 4 protein, partial [candidate division KSB1 bacterium]|nr:glycosyltransferase family 4 protein [candidate division KSB1 bacterium]